MYVDGRWGQMQIDIGGLGGGFVYNFFSQYTCTHLTEFFINISIHSFYVSYKQQSKILP